MTTITIMATAITNRAAPRNFAASSSW